MFATNKKIVTGTWNVIMIYQCGQLANIKHDMNRLNFNILGMCKTRWESNGDFMNNTHTKRIIHACGEKIEKGVLDDMKKNYEILSNRRQNFVN